MDLTNVLFLGLNCTNKLLLINDKDNKILEDFTNKYFNISKILVINNETILEKPLINNHYIIKLSNTVAEAYLDESLNSLVDVIYADITEDIFPFNFLNNTIDLNITTLIFKIKLEVEFAVYNVLKQKTSKDFLLFKIDDEEGYLVYVP